MDELTPSASRAQDEADRAEALVARGQANAARVHAREALAILTEAWGRMTRRCSANALGALVDARRRLEAVAGRQSRAA